MTRYFILVLILFLGITELTAQTKSIRKTAALAETQPESAGVSTERLKRIDKMCEEAVAEGRVPGIVSLVARNGKIVHWEAKAHLTGVVILIPSILPTHREILSELL